MCSAREGNGIEEVWAKLVEFRDTMNQKNKVSAHFHLK